MTGQLAPASIWILKKFVDLEKKLELNLEKYELAHSIDSLYKFLWDYYADWYVEYLKTDSSQFFFAKDLFKQFILILAPYMPFESEALWTEFYAETQSLATISRDPNWSKSFLSSSGASNQDRDFQKAIEFISDLRSLRGLFGLDVAKKLEIYTPDSTLELFKKFIEFSGKCTLIFEENQSLYQVKTENYVYSLDILAYLSDKEKEIQRTQKSLLSLEKQIQSLNNQLGNPEFLNNASQEVVSQKRDDLNLRNLELVEQQKKLKFLTEN